MKKNSSLFLCLLLLITFSLYSCASGTKDADKTEPEAPLTEETDTEEITEKTAEPVEEPLEPAEEQNDSTENETPVENNEENFIFPDELNEPDVFEDEKSEISEETTDINVESNEDENNKETEKEQEELISLDELDEIIPDTNLSENEITEIEIPDETTNDNDDDIIDLTEASSDSSDIILENNTEQNQQNESDSDNTAASFEETNKEQEASAAENIINDETTEIAENPETPSEEEIQIDEIVPSRKVSIKRGEYLDIVYPGNGWIYVGVIDGSKDLTYNGRKLGTENTTFTLIGKNPGTKIVHFYKTDNLTGNFIDDYIEIEISKDRTTSKVHQIAPDYSEIVPAKPGNSIQKKNTSQNIETESKNETSIDSSAANSERNTAEENKNNEDDDIEFLEAPLQQRKSEVKENDSNSETEIQQISAEEEQTLENQQQTVDTDALLNEAIMAFNEKNYENALKLIEDYINLASKKLDEAYFIKGQIYEAQSGIQNINNAVNEYEKILKLYPSSKYWDKANKRIIYLKRFYLEVR